VKIMRPLIISPHYTTFIKSPVQALSEFVEEINVLVHHNKLAELSNYIPLNGYFNHVRRYTKRNLIDSKDVAKNVKVHLISSFYFIPDSSNKRLADKLAKKFEEYIRKNRIEFELIHTHFTWPCGYVGARLKEWYGVPLVITAHRYDICDLPFRNELWRDKIRYALKMADVITTVSRKNLECIKKLDEKIQTKVPIHVIPNGFSDSLFYPRDRIECRNSLDIDYDKKVVLAVSNLIKRKGLHFLIEAMSRISRKRNDVMCFIGGIGPFKKELQELIIRFKLSNVVKLVGYVPLEKMSTWMSVADVFVLPSLAEGNPTVMFEALGCGVPFVGTKVGGVPEIITSEDYGLLCEPGNAEDLAEKILIALDKKWDREKIRKYAEQFTWENIAKQIVAVYESVLKK